MPNPQPIEAVITIDKAGRYLDANAAALDLLGVSLDELRASEPGRFAVQPAIESEQAALRNPWEAGGEQLLVGTAGLRRADGSTVRVSYAVETVESGFLARIRPVEGSPEAPATLFTVGEVLREWRAAERVLAELAPGTPEWTRTQGEVEMLRGRYQRLFGAAEPPSGGAST
jgi:PAS domain S-box-containing protein